MNLARADAIAARSQLAANGWISRHAESFRHLPPPDAPAWLGEAGLPGDESPRLWTAWQMQTLHRNVQARWLDAVDPAERALLLDGLPPPGGESEAAPFAWAHRALVRDGLRLRVGPAQGNAIVRIARERTEAVEAPLLVVDVLPGSRCVLVETHEADATAQNLQVHVNVGRGAHVQHLRIVAGASGRKIAHHVHVHADESALYEQCLLATGGDYHLQRTLVELQGHLAKASVSGVLLSRGAAMEQQVHSRHLAPGTGSAVEMLVLGSGAARMVANASTFIAAGCDEADARQRLAGIPTAGQPKLVLRPHLEIHHDKVQAAHGATWGALPEDALFHARQRGLDEDAAKAMIIEGLARAVFARGIAGALDQEGLGVDEALSAAVRRHLAPAPAKEGVHG